MLGINKQSFICEMQICERDSKAIPIWKIESLKSKLPHNQVDQAQNDNRQKLAGSPMLPRLVINLASMTPTTLSPFISNQDSGI